MTMWIWVLLASGLSFLTKLVGYLVPRSVLDRPVVTRLNALLPIALLAALAGTSAFTAGDGTPVLDARAIAFLVAALALWRRVPFLAVVILAAVVAAAARALGVP